MDEKFEKRAEVKHKIVVRDDGSLDCETEKIYNRAADVANLIGEEMYLAGETAADILYSVAEDIHSTAEGWEGRAALSEIVERMRLVKSVGRTGTGTVGEGDC